MPRVWVDEIGANIDFPDDMTPREIEAEIVKFLDSRDKEKPDKTSGGFARGARALGSELLTGARDILNVAQMPGRPGGITAPEFMALTNIRNTVAPRGEAETRGEKIGETIGTIAGSIGAEAPYWAAATPLGLAGPGVAMGGAEAIRQAGGMQEELLRGGDVRSLESMARDTLGSTAEGLLFGTASKYIKPSPSRAANALKQAAAGAGIFGTGAAIRGDSVEEGAGLGAGFGAILGALTKGKGKLPPTRKPLTPSQKERIEREYAKETGLQGFKPPKVPLNFDLMNPQTRQWAEKKIISGEIKNPERISWEDMVALAKKEGRSDVERNIALAHIDDFSKKYGGGKLAGEEVIVGRMFNDAGAETRKVLDDIARAEAAGDAATVAKLQQRYDDIAEETMLLAGGWQGYGTEAARALSARNALRQGLPMHEQALLYLQKRKELNREAFDKVMAAATDDEIRAITKTAWEPTIGDKIHEAWLMGMLSNPLTWGLTGVNVLSNLAKDTLLRIPVKATQAAIEPLAAKLSGRKSQYTFKDLAEDFRLDIQTSRAGIRSFLSNVLHDKPMDKGKLELTHGAAIGGQAGASALERAAGYVTRTPGRFLEAADQFFRTKAEAREALLLAKDKVKAGASFKDRAAKAKEIANNPKAYKEELKRIQDAGNEAVFTRSLREQADYSAVAKIANVAQNLKQSPNRAVSIPAKMTFPFTRTPANIVIEAINLSPFGYLEAGRLQSLLKKQQAILSAGGKIQGKEILARDVTEQIAKSTIGTAMMTWAFGEAAEGNITGGGPTDPQAYQNWLAAGNQPYSFKVGDKWVSYQRIEPFASLFGFAADVAETGRAPDQEKFDRAVAAVKDNLANKTFLLGVENLSKAWANPKRYGTTFAKSIASTAVPAIVGGAARAQDPAMRMTTSDNIVDALGNAIKMRVPGMRETLEQRHTVTGTPVEDPYSFVNALVPARIKDASRASIVDKEIDRLGQLGLRVPTMPKRKRSVPGIDETVAATAEEYATFHEYNKRAADVLERIMSQPSWSSLTPEKQAEIINGIYDNYKQYSSSKVRLDMAKNRN